MLFPFRIATKKFQTNSPSWAKLLILTVHKIPYQKLEGFLASFKTNFCQKWLIIWKSLVSALTTLVSSEWPKIYERRKKWITALDLVSKTKRKPTPCHYLLPNQTDDYAKDGGPGEVWLSCSFCHESLRTWIKTTVNMFAISNHTALILGVQALRSYLKLICEYELHSLPNKSWWRKGSR